MSKPNDWQDSWNQPESKWEGEQVKLQNLENLIVTVLAVDFKESKYESEDGEKKTYASCQMQGEDGVRFWVNTAATAIVDQMQKNTDKIPFRAKVVKAKGQRGSYYTFQKPEE